MEKTLTMELGEVLQERLSERGVKAVISAHESRVVVEVGNLNRNWEKMFGDIPVPDEIDVSVIDVDFSGDKPLMTYVVV